MRAGPIVFETEMSKRLKQPGNCSIGAVIGGRVGVGVPLKKGVLKRSRLVEPSGESDPRRGRRAGRKTTAKVEFASSREDGHTSKREGREGQVWV